MTDLIFVEHLTFSAWLGRVLPHVLRHRGPRRRINILYLDGSRAAVRLALCMGRILGVPVGRWDYCLADIYDEQGQWVRLRTMYQELFSLQEAIVGDPLFCGVFPRPKGSDDHVREFVIKQITSMERIEYNHTGTPFIIRDRDFLFHAKAELRKDIKKMYFWLNSVNDPAMPESDCCVRGELKRGVYVLTALDGGKKTNIIVEIHADPKGSVPKWIVNLFQKKWPRKTLNGIRAQCAKPDVTTHVEIQKFFTEASMPATETPAARAKPGKKPSQGKSALKSKKT